MSGGYKKPNVDPWGAIPQEFADVWTAIRELQTPTGTQLGNTIASGDIILAKAVRTGFVAADGASYLNTTYPALFAAYGTTYGSADATHFNVPKITAPTPTTGTVLYIIKT